MMSEKEHKVPKRRFKEFKNADAWEQRKLGDVIDGLYNGQTPSRFRDDFWNGNINWLSSGELNRSVVRMTSEKITAAGQDNANLHIVPQNTFVMAITGLEAVGTRGNCGILGIDTTLNQSCMAVFPNEKLLSTQFLFQWYKVVGEDYGIRFTQGTKQQSYNAAIIKNLDICLPKIEEQSKISTFLSELDNLITLHQCKLEKTKALKKAYLTEMFPAEGERKPKLRFAGFTDNWEKRKFGDDIISIKTGTNLLGSITNKGTPLIKMGNIQRGYFSFNKMEYLHEEAEVEKENIINYGDFLFNTRNTLELVGKGATWMLENGKFAFNSNIARFVFKDINTIFFNYLYSTSFVITQVRARATGTTSVAAIYPQSLNSIIYQIPKINEQIKIGEFFRNLDNIIILHQRKLEKLENKKKAYLNEMFI